VALVEMVWLQILMVHQLLTAAAEAAAVWEMPQSLQVAMAVLVVEEQGVVEEVELVLTLELLELHQQAAAVAVLVAVETVILQVLEQQAVQA
jgi:hypothetical protein